MMRRELVTDGHELLGKQMKKPLRKDSISAWVFAIVFLVFAACSKDGSFEGDGTLTDNGVLSATDRYVLDVGEVELTKNGSYRYSFRGLPAENFVIGLEIEGADQRRECIRASLGNVEIGLRLSDVNKGMGIFVVEGKLKEWTFSRRRGEKRVFVYHRSGPRTAFDADPESTYELEVRVSKVAGTVGCDVAQIVAKSGGWK